MKRKLYFLLVLFECCLLSITQAQTNCDLSIFPNKSYDCLIEEYIKRSPQLWGQNLESCFLACKGNTIQYTAVCGGATEYFWEITGATHSYVTNQGSTVVVTWGTGVTGNISVHAVGDTVDCYDEYCVLLMDIPEAQSSSAPSYYYDSNGDKIIEICLGETIEFVDMSVAGNIPIEGHYWESAFGAASTPDYTLTPTQDGEYELVHCVRNMCGCEDCENYRIIVKEKVELDFSCYGTVCENTSAHYFIKEPPCEHYMWNVEGGSFEGQNSPEITVHWGSPSSGYGVISLDAGLCDTECPSLLSVQIPIITDSAEIVGPDIVCVGETHVYTLPLWGSTQYTWWSNGCCDSVHNSGSPHKLLLEFTQPGTVTIGATYECSFLGCGPFTTQKTILIKDTLRIFSDSENICKGSTAIFYTNSSSTAQWKIYNTDNTLIHSEDSDSLSYTFEVSGNYRVTASIADYCSTAEYEVTVLENPPALTTTQGPNVACLNGSILLSGTPTHPNYYLEWEPQCALVSPSSVSGNEVTITYAWEVCDVAVYQVHNEYGCRSQAYIHEVDTLVLAPHGLPAVTHTCVGSTVNIEIPNQAPNVLYEWELFPPNAASIQGDHLQPDIDVLTNHLYNFVSPTIVNMQLTRKFCAQEIVEIVRLSIEDVETPTLEFPDTVCANETVTFTANGNSNDNSHYRWSFSSNAQSVYGRSVTQTFSSSGYVYITLTYSPNPDCDTVVVMDSVYVYLLPVTIERDGNILSVQSYSNVSYRWVYQGENISTSATCSIVGDGEYCCIVTSMDSLSCTNSDCYTTESTTISDTCLPINLSHTLQCNVATVYTDTLPGAQYFWYLSSSADDSDCTPTSTTDSAIVTFTQAGTHTVYARTEIDGQCYKGSERIVIECVSAIKLTYNCNGYVVITDISKYKNGYTIPERSYTIPDVGSVSMLYPTMVDSINVGIPTDTITYVVNMSMNSSECTYSQSITLTPHPTITDIAYSPKMCINTPFQFTANTTGDIRNYKWDFGDNSYNYGNNIYHTYHTNQGNQSSIQLTVTDRWGCSATDTVYVEVGGTEPNGTLINRGNDVCMGEARVIQYLTMGSRIVPSHYYWRPNEIVTLSNWRTVYKTGDYTVLVVTDNYGCKVEDMTNVRFLNTPIAYIIGDSTYCFGEKVKLYGNSGNSNTYIWNISGPENHTFTTSNIQFTPTTPGNYSVLLTITSPDNCTATDSTTFVVYAQPTAPNVVVEGCIHEPPVEAISVSGETLLWSNGFRGTEAYYYNDGYLSAYYIDPTIGCPSEKAYAFIDPAPNYDALLTGCYAICSDSLTHQLPVYGFYPYHASQFQWFWFRDSMLLTQGTDLSPVLPLPNYGTYHLQTEYYDDFGNHCVSESPEFILENTFYCTCDSIQFKPENITCSVEGCKLIYTIRYTICNIGSHNFDFFDLQLPVGGELLSDNLPVDLPAGDCQTLEFSISLTDFTTTMFEFILRDRKQNCEISFVENLNWHTCVDSDCDIADFSFDFNPELSTAHQSSYFQFYAHIENAIEILSMWSRPSQVIDFVYNGSDVDGLLMLDYGLLTQMMANGQEFCLYMVSCVDGEHLCYDSLCIPAEQFFDVIPSEFRQLADNGSLDETLFEPTAEPLSLPAADKPYLAPNPAHNEVTVMGISSEKVVEIAVLTMKGEVVATHSLTHRFEIGRLANATYIVRVRTADNQIHYLKLVKQ